jgi:hypothetical protein
MLEALLEFIARWAGRFLLNVVFYSVLYPIGWLMLKVVTLGHYPPRYSHSREFVAIIPLVALAVGITFTFS